MEPDTTYPYFAYGSNLNRDEMLERCPDARPHVTARLEGLAHLPRRRQHRAGRGPNRPRRALVAEPRRRGGARRLRGRPSYYRQRIVQVQTDNGPRRAMAYLMERPSYLGLPSPGYFSRIAEGFDHWGLPVRDLQKALLETLSELEAMGVARYDPDGPKRLRAVMSRGGSQPSRLEAPDAPDPRGDLRVWLDDDLENRAAPAGWIHVTTAREAISLLDTERVVELSLDHDLGDDERFGRGTDVVDYLAEQQEIHGRFCGRATGSGSTPRTRTAAMRCAGRSTATPPSIWRSRSRSARGVIPCFGSRPRANAHADLLPPGVGPPSAGSGRAGRLRSGS